MGELPNALISNCHIPQTKGLQIGDHRLSISCAVGERPDHLCGDDLVALNTLYSSLKRSDGEEIKAVVTKLTYFKMSALKACHCPWATSALIVLHPFRAPDDFGFHDLMINFNMLKVDQAQDHDRRKVHYGGTFLLLINIIYVGLIYTN